MWYISFHGGSSGRNNNHVYDDDGNAQGKLLIKDDSTPKISEIRAMAIRNGLLYIANGSKKCNQVLSFKPKSDQYEFNEVVASKEVLPGIFHPYDFTFDEKGRIYVTNQDSNAVIGLSIPNNPMLVANYLTDNYSPANYFLKGTQVASSLGKLPGAPTTPPPNVALPQGLDVNFTDDSKSKIAHSVRGIVYYKQYLFVSDEPGNSVKVYDNTGKLQGQIEGDNLDSPVQLLLNSNVLYIGSSGNASVLSYDLSKGIPTGVVQAETFINGQVDSVSGIAFGPNGHFYAAARKAEQILKFYMDGSGKVETFIDKDSLQDNPEFILYVPNSN